MELPQDILERVGRVQRFHQQTKCAYPQPLEPPGLDPRVRPSPYRVFDAAPRVPLSTTLLDVPTDTLHLLADHLDALPESMLSPPQTLKTLSTWLFMADGLTQKKQEGRTVTWSRSCPSGGAAYPYEVYVAAFAIEGLEPGLYHYCPKEFGLRKLRDGRETLSLMKRGRPDLELLKTVPAALLVSTIWARSSWQFGRRAYRCALADAGHLVGNLAVAGTGLGITTLTRLRMTESSMRELIGLPPDGDFGQEEAVQAMVVWADKATNPMPLPPTSAINGSGNVSVSGNVGGAGLLPEPGQAHPLGVGFDGRPSTTSIFDDGGASGSGGGAGTHATSQATAQGAQPTTRTVPSAPPRPTATGPCALPPIPRAPLAASCTAFASILAVHSDCVAPGVAVREVRPPLTELSPLPANVPVAEFPPPGDAIDGLSLRQVLLAGKAPTDFDRTPVSRDRFMALNRLAFRGGTYFPMYPAGPHVGLVRPFWLVHDVTGVNSGIWYYHPPTDAWSQLGRSGEYRLEAAYLSMEQPMCGNASAVCFLFANLHQLMAGAGPDAYRLSHLEAGIVAQRMTLAAASMELGAIGIGGFYDEEVKAFFGLANTGWEPMYGVAVGAPFDPNAPKRVIEVEADDDKIWADSRFF
jgi:SagB-type dehydrogenase family enzyme